MLSKICEVAGYNSEDKLLLYVADQSDAVRIAVVNHSLAGDKVFRRAIQDANWHVREVAARRTSCPWVLNDALSDSINFVKIAALKNPCCSVGEMKTAANDPDHHVSSLACALLNGKGSS